MNSDESPPGPRDPVSFAIAGARELRILRPREVGRRTTLSVGGGMPERFPPAPASGENYLRNHPEHSGVYLVFHPIYWFLELTGRAEERWPVRLRIGDHRSVAATLVRKRTDHSAPHPGLSIEVPAAPVLDAIVADDSIRVGADGSGFALDARFVPSANARRAAALMRAACTAATS